MPRSYQQCLSPWSPSPHFFQNRDGYEPVRGSGPPASHGAGALLLVVIPVGGCGAGASQLWHPEVPTPLRPRAACCESSGRVLHTADPVRAPAATACSSESLPPLHDRLSPHSPHLVQLRCCGGLQPPVLARTWRAGHDQRARARPAQSPCSFRNASMSFLGYHFSSLSERQRCLPGVACTRRACLHSAPSSRHERGAAAKSRRRVSSVSRWGCGASLAEQAPMRAGARAPCTGRRDAGSCPG